MKRSPNGVAHLLETEYALGLIRQGLSYTSLSQQLTEHFGVKIARGSINYFFKTSPDERQRWERARKKTRPLDENRRLEQKAKDLEERTNEVLRLMHEEAKKDPNFRDTLRYYRENPTSFIPPEKLYKAFRLIRQGKHYISVLMQKTGLQHRNLAECSRISGVVIPNGHFASRTSQAELDRILSRVPKHGYTRTARMLGIDRAKVYKIATRNGVYSPLKVGHPKKN